MSTLFNAMAEQIVIGCCLQGEIIADELEGLQPEHFAIESHREAFAAILRTWGQGRPLDAVTLDDYLTDGAAKREGLAYWAECAEAGFSTALLPGHISTVRNKAVRRALAATADKIAGLAHSEGRVDELVASASALLASVSAGESRRGPRLIADVLREHLPAVGERWDGRRDGLMTGFADLDKALGGLRPGNLALIAARPAMGKTSLAMQIAANVAEDRAVVVFSQEMADTELADRLIALKGGVDLGKVIRGGMSEDEHSRFNLGVMRLRDMLLYVDDEPAQRITDIRAKTMKVRRQREIGLVVVDYLQLMTGDGANRNAEIEQISRGLKALAKELGCPVIALSQLSRKCEERPNKRPMLSDLRDSGAIEQDADVVMMIYRDEVYNPSSPDAGTAEILIRKNRQGAIGDVRLTWRGEITAFGNCDYQASRRQESAPQRKASGMDEW
jgi:replicative DNA helicase